MIGKRFTKEEIAERIVRAKENLIEFKEYAGLKIGMLSVGAKPTIKAIHNRLIIENAEYVEYHEQGLYQGLAADAFAVDISDSGILELHDPFAFSVQADNSDLLVLNAPSAQYVSAKEAPVTQITIDDATEFWVTPEQANLAGYRTHDLRVSSAPVTDTYAVYFDRSEKYVVGDFKGNIGDVIEYAHGKNPDDLDAMRALRDMVMVTRSSDQINDAVKTFQKLGLIKR